MPPERAYLRDALVRFALFAWVVGTAVVCVRSALAPERASVFPIFREAARAWCRGEDAYRPVMHDHYRYSPTATLLLVPFAVLPDSAGGSLWRLVSIAAYLAALVWWLRDVVPRVPGPRAAGAVLLLVLPLSLSNFNNGQSNILVLALLLAAGAAAASDRWHLAALTAASACFFKGYPLAVGLLLAALFPRRFGGRFVLALLAGLALPFACQQPGYVVGQYQRWAEQLRLDDRQQTDCEGTYRDVRLPARVLGIPPSEDAFRLLQVLSGAAALGVGLLGRSAGWERRRVLHALLGLGCFWMVLFGPATESSTYLLLAPFLAWCLVEAVRRPRWPDGRAFTLAGAALLLACAMAVWFPFGRSVHALGLQALGGLLLLAGFLLRLFAETRSLAVTPGGLRENLPCTSQLPS